MATSTGSEVEVPNLDSKVMVGCPGLDGLSCPAAKVAARVDLGDNVIWVGVALSGPAVTVPVAFDVGVVGAEICWVGLTILGLTEAMVGAVLFVGVEADKSILVGRGVLNDPLGVADCAGTGVAGSGVFRGALGVDESTATGEFSTK